MCLYKYMHMDTHVCVPHSYCRAHCSFVSQPQINLEVLIVVAVLKKKIFTISSFSCKKTLVDFTGKMFSKCLQGIPACCSAPSHCPVQSPWLPALHRGERYHIPGPWPWGSRRAVTRENPSICRFWVRISQWQDSKQLTPMCKEDFSFKIFI